MKKIHRFIGQWQLAHGNVRIDDADLVHQVRKVLKLEPGETVILGDGTGNEATCTILAADRTSVTVNCTAIGRNANEPQTHLILYCAVLKGEHFEEAAAMATQIGVREIVPVRSARTVKLNLRSDRIDKIVREASELSGRGVIPTLADSVDFDGALTHAYRNDANLFLDPSGKPLTTLGKGNRKVGVFIGPEGGWDEGEVQRAQDYGLRIISLGPLVLRAPVAAAVGTYLVLHALERH
jgi:16S rRNA (uracil1498-N3)-methyltransferase